MNYRKDQDIMIKLIIFDLGNVLLKETGIISNDVGKKLSVISYESMYDSNFNTELDNFCSTYNYDKAYLKEQLKQYFNSRYQLTLNESELQNLSCKYKLGIGSNFISDIICRFDGIKHYFDIIALSGAMEVEKPNRDFFDKIIEEAVYLGIFPREILFIDDKQENLKAAEMAGMITMHYDNTIEDCKPLYSAIQDHIKYLEDQKQEEINTNHRLNGYLNHIKQRPNMILKEKLDKQNSATYNETTVGAIPVLDYYGFKPTTTDTVGDKIDRLKELGTDQNNVDEETLAFNEELLLDLNNFTIPVNIEDMYPVYIMLSYGATTMGRIIKTATKDPYSHSSISFDSSLRNIYSFDKSGFVNEDIKKGNYSKKDNYKYSLYVLFVNQDQLKLMDKYLTNIKSKADKLSYSIKGCINLFFNKETHDTDKMFCSQFVSEIIKSALTSTVVKKDPSLYKPYDLRKLKGCFFVQKGYLKNYNEGKTKKRTQEIKDKILNMTKNEGYLFNYFRSNDNGDLILRYRKMNYKEEYNKSHKLIKIYKSSNDVEGIKRELAKLWSYYLIIEEIYIQKGKNEPELKKTQEYKDAIVAKAFILGDVKEGIKFIHKTEPDFDFVKYYEESPYNKDVVIITKKDIQNIIRIMKTLL